MTRNNQGTYLSPSESFFFDKGTGTASLVAGMQVMVAFAPGSTWSGLKDNVREFYLQ
jgi:hypothetical protein